MDSEVFGDVVVFMKARIVSALLESHLIASSARLASATLSLRYDGDCLALRIRDEVVDFHPAPLRSAVQNVLMCALGAGPLGL